MSPTSTTGASARCAIAMLAMSCSRRLISAGLPAPSMTIRSWRRRSAIEALGHHGPDRLPHARVVAELGRPPHGAAHDHLGRAVGLRLEEHRIHVHAGHHAGGFGLGDLGAPDLTPFCRAGVERHVLGLERRHADAGPGEEAAQRSGQDALAHTGAGALNHQARRSPTRRRPGAPARHRRSKTTGRRARRGRGARCGGNGSGESPRTASTAASSRSPWDEDSATSTLTTTPVGWIRISSWTVPVRLRRRAARGYCRLSWIRRRHCAR